VAFGKSCTAALKKGQGEREKCAQIQKFGAATHMPCKGRHMLLKAERVGERQIGLRLLEKSLTGVYKSLRSVQSGDSSELAPRLPCKGKSVRNRGVSQTMPFLVIPRSLLRGGFISSRPGQRGYPGRQDVSLQDQGQRVLET
jgi:hypothetical protein